MLFISYMNISLLLLGMLLRTLSLCAPWFTHLQIPPLWMLHTKWGTIAANRSSRSLKSKMWCSVQHAAQVFNYLTVISSPENLIKPIKKCAPGWRLLQAPGAALVQSPVCAPALRTCPSLGSSHRREEKPSAFCTVLLSWVRKKGELLQVSGHKGDCLTGFVCWKHLHFIWLY